MKKFIAAIFMAMCFCCAQAQTYFYHDSKTNMVVVLYFVNSNKIVREFTYYQKVRDVLMSNMNAYEENLSRHASHDMYYDLNSGNTSIISCNYFQTLSGYNIYGYMFKAAFMYGNYQKQIDFGVSADKETVVRDITANTHSYYKHVPKSFFLPSL